METCTHNLVAGKHLRRILMAVTGLALLLIPLVFTARTDAAGVASVALDANGLSPKVVTVQVGTTVTWQPADGAKHRIRSTSGPVTFDSGGLAAGATWSFTFTSVGTVNYQDDENKGIAAYQGSIVVANTVTTTVPPTTVPGTPTTTPAPATVDVRIANRAFSPASISIFTGDTVRWTNADKEAHTVTERNFAFDSGSFGSGAVWSRTFPTAGTFSYYCDIHPSMVAVVAVTARTTTGTLPPPPPPPTTPTVPPTTAPPGGGTGTGAGGGTTGSGTGGSTGGTTVSIADFSFSPAVLTVDQGASVTWTNTGLARHTVAADDGSFHSPDVRNSQTYTRTFDTPGTYTYLCDIHPDMKGTIAVRGSGGTPPPPAPSTTSPSAVTAKGDIAIADFRFAPATITITAGQSLTFVNTGAARHSATARDGSFDTGLLPRGQTATRSFPTAGTFQYFCTLHANMTGTILVRGKDGSAPPPPKVVVAAVAKDGDVQIVDFDFRPKTLTVAAGASVGFTNGGVAPHTATSKDGTWDTGIVRSGGTVRVTFDTPGTFTYYCTIHPQMVATLLVTGTDGAAPPPEAAAAAPVTPTQVGVKVLADTFEPADARIAAGGSVTWTVDSLSPHIVQSEKDVFTSDLLHKGQSFTFTFDKPGTYRYHDGLTGQMVGTVTVVAPAGSTTTGASADGRSAAVDIIDLDFTPREVTVMPGAEVTWTNTGQAPHTVTAKDGAWSSELMQNGDTFAHTFDTTGRFTYICNLHPNMVGTIIVTDAAGATPTASAPQPAAALVGPGAGSQGTPLLLVVLGGGLVGLAAFLVGRRSGHHAAVRV